MIEQNAPEAEVKKLFSEPRDDENKPDRRDEETAQSEISPGSGPRKKKKNFAVKKQPPCFSIRFSAKIHAVRGLLGSAAGRYTQSACAGIGGVEVEERDPREERVKKRE